MALIADISDAPTVVIGGSAAYEIHHEADASVSTFIVEEEEFEDTSEQNRIIGALPEYLQDHDYSVRSIPEKEIKADSWILKTGSIREVPKADSTGAGSFAKHFSKCDQCRRSRTKVLVPETLLSITKGKDDGVTCDFCGAVMNQAQPQTLPDVFEGRRGSKGGDIRPDKKPKKKDKNYVYCGECGKVILKESMSKHYKDVHEKSNKRTCPICHKVLSGPFSLKEHISAVHNKQTKHQCPHCHKMFAHFSNMNRHIRLIHDKMVVTHKYVNCPVCQKVVQSTSLKKHMAAIHEQRRDFKCQHCEKSFAQSYTLKEHTAAKHTFEYEHSCKLCGKAFAHKTNCGRHLKTVHREALKDKYENEQDMIRDCIAIGKVNVRDLKESKRLQAVKEELDSYSTSK